MADYFIGQVFVETYPEDLAQWCEEHGCYIADEPPINNKKRFKIKAIPAPTSEEIKAARIEDIKNQLDDIDKRKMRPVSAILLEQATQADIDKLNELEAQTLELREEMNKLK